MNKCDKLLKLLEYSHEFEYDVEVEDAGDGEGWHIVDGGSRYFINNVLEDDWIEKHKPQKEDEGISLPAQISFDADITYGHPGTYHEPPEGDEVNIGKAFLHIEGHPPIEITDDLEAWSKLHENLIDRVYDKMPDRYDNEPDYEPDVD